VDGGWGKLLVSFPPAAPFKVQHTPAIPTPAMPASCVCVLRAAHGACFACCPCSVIQQLRARGAYLIVVCNEGDTDVEEICQGHASLVKVPLVSHPFTKLLGAVTSVADRREPWEDCARLYEWVDGTL